MAVLEGELRYLLTTDSDSSKVELWEKAMRNTPDEVLLRNKTFISDSQFDSFLKICAGTKKFNIDYCNFDVNVPQVITSNKFNLPGITFGNCTLFGGDFKEQIYSFMPKTLKPEPGKSKIFQSSEPIKGTRFLKGVLFKYLFFQVLPGQSLIVSEDKHTLTCYLDRMGFDSLYPELAFD
jgi:hypothetical protein